MIVNILQMFANFMVLHVLPVVVVILIVIRLYIKVTSGWCRSTRDMSGKTVVITGATSGIGKETARDLARRNARVILACRSMERGQKAANEIIAQTGNRNVLVKMCDLSELSSTRKFAEEILNTEDRLDVLINNAALVADSRRRDLTSDGFEVQFATNHLGPFLLTNLLLDLLIKSAPSRIVNVSSCTYILSGKIDFDNLNLEKEILHPFSIYCRMKLLNILFTKELHRRLCGTNVSANSLHPGVTRTKTSTTASPLVKCFAIPAFCFLKTIEEAAQTVVYLAVSEDVEGVSGKFFADCAEKNVCGFQANSEELAKKLWDISVQFTGLNNEHKKVEE